jgi:ATP-dependent Clp protease adapter protein ClpS
MNPMNSHSEHDVPFGEVHQFLTGPIIDAAFQNATATVVATSERTDPKTNPKTKGQRPHVVIVYNDDEHTPEFVVTVLMEVCKMDQDQAIEATVKIHNEGQAAVWHGLMEHCELVREQIESFNKDDAAIAAGCAPCPLKVEVREG